MLKSEVPIVPHKIIGVILCEKREERKEQQQPLQLLQPTYHRYKYVKFKSSVVFETVESDVTRAEQQTKYLRKYLLDGKLLTRICFVQPVQISQEFKKIL